MSVAPLLRRLELFGALSPGERDTITGLAGAPKTIARHGAIRRENDAVAGVFLLIEGWVSSSTMRRNGGVFISRIHLPGEMMGASSLGHGAASETLTALSAVTFAMITKARIGGLFAAAPRLAALLFLDSARDAAALADSMASVARASAESRVAALLINLYDRACTIDPAQVESLDFPLTQGDIADTLGLTSVHVSRMMRHFIDRGWLRRGQRALMIKNPDALRSLAAVTPRSPDHRAEWLPPAV